MAAVPITTAICVTPSPLTLKLRPRLCHREACAAWRESTAWDVVLKSTNQANLLVQNDFFCDYVACGVTRRTSTHSMAYMNGLVMAIAVAERGWNADLNLNRHTRKCRVGNRSRYVVMLQKLIGIRGKPLSENGKLLSPYSRKLEAGDFRNQLSSTLRDSKPEWTPISDFDCA